MKIAVPIGQFHAGTTGEYVAAAFIRLGHETTILNQQQFEEALVQKAYDLFFCVDSGVPISLSASALASTPLCSVAYWFIDYRHNKDRQERSPTDRQTALMLQARGGFVFQSQWEDLQDCLAMGVERAAWLPLGADSEVWNSEPAMPIKLFDVGFVGNIWDQARLDALKGIQVSGLKLGFFGPSALWKEKAASVLRSSRLGFNISTLFGTPAAFDLNMRFFETLSCGIPLVTNAVPALSRLFPTLPPFIKTYSALEEISPLIDRCLQDKDFLQSGAEARSWVTTHATYEIRMQSALELLGHKLSLTYQKVDI